jgi:putative peptide zinc metalloprotease protein
LTLENIDTHLALERLTGERHKYLRRLQTLRQRAFEDEQAALQIAEVEQAVAAIDEQIVRRRQDTERLAIRAPRSGVLLPAPRVERPAHDQGRLSSWFGSPLDEQNRDAFLHEGTAICHIGDPDRFNAILAIDQTELEFVRVGQPVDILLEQLPGQRFRSELAQLSLLDLKIPPRGLSSKQGGELLTGHDSHGQERPLSTTFQASASLVDDAGLLFLGATGKARIRVGSQSLARRVWRYLCHTFHFVA